MKWLIGGIVAALALFALVVVVSGISWKNTAVAVSNAATAQVQQNQNLNDLLWKQVSAVAQVPTQHKKDFVEAMQAEMAGRYGADGSKAVVSFVREKSAALSGALTEVKQSYEFTLEALAAMLDAREHATAQHSQRARNPDLASGTEHLTIV